MINDFHSRRSLALRLSQLITSDAVITAASSGIFITVQKRTGTSTFLRRDLYPALQQRGSLAIYANLGQGLLLNPLSVINEAVIEALQWHLSSSKVTQNGYGNSFLAHASIYSDFEVEFADINDVLSLTSLFVKRKIVLVLDDSHLLNDDCNRPLLCAMKSVRDKLNSSHYYGLRVVFVGSNTERLKLLCTEVDQPFFGASLHALPPPDKGFINWLHNRAQAIQTLSPNDLYILFQDFGHQPELFLEAAERFTQVARSKNKTNLNLELFYHTLRMIQQERHRTKLKSMEQLSSLEAMALRLIYHKYGCQNPFDTQTLKAHFGTRKNKGDCILRDPIHPEAIQDAIATLLAKKFLWRSSRGCYFADDEELAELLS